MILADKILTLRKNSGWSQEELAEKLNVSRQSISKWEGASSIPDIGKIIEMSKLFGVTTDYLLRDDMEQAAYTGEDSAALRRVGLEEANAFVEDWRAYGKKVATGVLMCILSPVLLIVLPVLLGSILSFSQGGAAVETPEALAAGVGLVVLLLMVACAVVLFIVSSSAVRKYRYVEQGNFELGYGVAGVLREQWSARESRHTAFTAAGVVLCILSPIPLVVAGLAEASDLVCVLFTGLLLVIVGVAVHMIIRLGTEKECYDRLLREDEYAPDQVEVNKRTEKLGGIYWPVATAVYLAWSFISRRWDVTWLVWPVAGVLYGAISAIVKMSGKN